MKTVAEIQEMILSETGIKTSVKKLTGSMKNHVCFSSMFQNGNYPKFPFEWRNTFIKQFSSGIGYGNYSHDYGIDILNINISEYNPVQYKKETKPKPMDDTKISKGWGSKNSQLRLDKAAARYAKALRNGQNKARYY